MADATLNDKVLALVARAEKAEYRIANAYREGWEDRDRHSETCLGEAVLDSDWRISETAEMAKEKDDE